MQQRKVLVLAAVAAFGLGAASIAWAEWKWPGGGEAKEGQAAEGQAAEAQQAAEPEAAVEQKPVAVDFRELEKLAKEAPEFAVDLYRMAGQWSLNHNRAPKAVLFYEQALKVSPGELRLLEELADAQGQAGKPKEAIATWEKVLEAQKGDVGTRVRYAAFLDKVGESAKGIQTMRALAAERPEEVSFHYWIVDAYARQGKNSEAAQELREILKAFPAEKAEVQRRLGLVEPKKAEKAPEPVEEETTSKGDHS